MAECYLYGFTRGPVEPRCGIEGLLVKGEQLGGITALRSDLPPGSRKRFQDLGQDAAWVARRGMEHHEVLTSALPQDVVPVAFGTLFDSPGALARFASRHHAHLAGELDRLRGRGEFVVQLEALPSAPAPVPPGAGAGFLQARLLQRRALESAAKEQEAAARRVAKELDLVSDEATLRSKGDAWELTILAERARKPLIEAAAERADAGFLVTVQGPWPCYSFVRAPEVGWLA